MEIPKAKILKVVKPKPQKEGVGAMVYRVLGTYEMKTFDPFLMLDFFYTKLPSGFPDHPHRGFQTLTYLLQGEMLHEDFKGNKGTLHPGDIQWMIAGKGMVHAEIPGTKDEETIGFQLWINLPQKEKMCDPFYLDKPKDLIPIFKNDDYFVRIVSGRISGVSGAIKSHEYKTPIQYFDVHLNAQKKFTKTTEGGWHTFLFVYEGKLKVNDQEVDAKSGVFFETSEEGDLIECEAFDTTAKFIWIGGEPINENVEWHGPFVMNEKQELQQALHDYHSGSNGFEGAPKWSSKIKDKMNDQFNYYLQCLLNFKEKSGKILPNCRTIQKILISGNKK